jgi:signal transduction histidine kinase
VELKKPIEIIYNYSLVDAYIMADEQSTAKTIEFIIDNAVKFTKTGYIRIELFQNEDNKYQLSIEDSGIGIAEDYKNKIYEPFSQEDMSGTREYEGIGLSLSLAYEYALVNKFEMSFESKKGIGTKFILLFDKCTEDIIDI